MSKLNAMILCRVSTTKQAEQGDSLEDQEKICRDYCNNNDINVIDVHHEPGISGKLADRKALRKILVDIKNYHGEGKIDYLIFLKIDRFGRMDLGEYENLKNEFLKLGTQLKDVYGVIQEAKQLKSIPGVKMEKYKWNYSDNKMSQNMQMMWSREEGNAILQRTIPQEIELARRGYSVGNPPYGYKNDKTADKKKSSIYMPRDGESKVVAKIFKWRAEGMADIKIVNKLKRIGATTRVRLDGSGGKPFTVKRIQELVVNPKYAGVAEGEWTGERAIGIKGTSIVTIKVFNEANKGKIMIVDLHKEDTELGVKLYDILYNVLDNHSWDKEKTVQKKVKNIENDLFPYTKLIYSPFGNKMMSGSVSRGRKGDKVAYYHATVPFTKPELFRKGHTLPKTKATKGHYYGVKKAIFEETVLNFLGTLQPRKELIDIYVAFLRKIWSAKRTESTEINDGIKITVVELENREAQISRTIDKLVEISASNESILKKTEELKEIADMKIKLEKETKLMKKQVKKSQNIDDFIEHGVFLLEHIQEAFKNAESYNQRKFIFDVIFQRMPYYDELVDGTQNLSPLWACIKENSQNKSESFWENLEWLPELDSNQGPTG